MVRARRRSVRYARASDAQPHAMKVKTTKMTVLLLILLLNLAVLYADPNDQTQIEKYNQKFKTYKLDVPGKQPITIIETATSTEDARQKWEDISIKPEDKDDIEMKNLMTHIIHDIDENAPRCYGPSCQEGFNPDQGPHTDYEEQIIEEKLKDYRDISQDRIQAITALAAKLKKEKLKADRYSSMDSDQDHYSSMDSEQPDPEEDDNSKVYTTWNRLKVKQHKHPFDDKDGWVTLEPVAWSTSKISKWKPNVKKHKPNHWSDDDERFPSDDPYNNYQSMSNSNLGNSNSYSYSQKKPSIIVNRPQFINNKLHLPTEYDAEMPSRPSWIKPQHTSFSSTWAPDDVRRPHKPNCDHEESYPGDSAVFYGISDSVVTDHRPSNFPYDYEALHQQTQRPMRRPTQVVYAGSPELDSDRAVNGRPPHGDGQWVLLSTTKGYRNKKRQRSLNIPTAEDRADYGSVTSHQAVALTVLPVDDAHANMTTSHGGLLEVEKSFQTVEESKRDMDKLNDLSVAESSIKPVFNRVVRRRVVSNVAPDTSTILAAVGAGMVPATMAMMVPMMLGKRRRRRDTDTGIEEEKHLDNIFYKLH